MSDDNSNAFPNEQALAQQALSRVRAVFRGNGIKSDKILLSSHKVARHTMNAGTYLELKPVLNERSTPGKTVSGQVVNSRDEAMRAIDQTMISAARDTAAQAQIANVLLARPDQGFGLSRQAVPIDFLRREYTWHEACQTCRGTSQAPCQRCQGRKLETCVKCTGRGLMPCPLCRATGLLQGNKCNRCHGHRYVPCDGCQRSGMMACRMCHATGVSKCATCAGQGWKSHVLSLSAQALTYFEYDAKSVPKGAADTIETQSHLLAADGRIKVKGRMADDKENALGASYEVEFPYGEVVFSLGTKEVKANLFGYKADLVEFPFVLDKMLGPAVEELEEAANDVGSVAEKIRKATRFRLIAQAFILASRMSVKKAVSQLMKGYEIGLSIGMAEKLVLLADRTTTKITRKPRLVGFALGQIAAAVLAAAYYLLPLRSSIAAQLPDPRLDIVLDLLPPLLGGFVTTILIQLVAARAIQTALGHLAQGGKRQLVPKTQSLGLWGYAGAVVLALAVIELSGRLGRPSPYWYEFLTNMAERALAG